MDLNKRPKIALAITFLLASCGTRASDATRAQICPIAGLALASLVTRGLPSGSGAISQILSGKLKSGIWRMAQYNAFASLEMKHAGVLVSIYNAYSCIKSWLNRDSRFIEKYLIDQGDSASTMYWAIPKPGYSANLLNWYQKQHQLISIYSLLRNINGCAAYAMALQHKPNCTIPPIVEETFDKINYSYNPNKIIISDAIGDNACAHCGGTVIIGAKCLELGDSQISAILGHEISHITERHCFKKSVFGFLLDTFLTIGIAATKDFLENLLAKNSLKDCPYANECLLASIIIIDSPLFEFIASKAIYARYVRRQEKEADLAAVTKLGDASGAIDYFKSQALKKQNSSYVIFNPLNWIYKIDELPFFRIHPSDEERIAYLTEYEKTLAQSQS